MAKYFDVKKLSKAAKRISIATAVGVWLLATLGVTSLQMHYMTAQYNLEQRYYLNQNSHLINGTQRVLEQVYSNSQIVDSLKSDSFEESPYGNSPEAARELLELIVQETAPYIARELNTGKTVLPPVTPATILFVNGELADGAYLPNLRPVFGRSVLGGYGDYIIITEYANNLSDLRLFFGGYLGNIIINQDSFKFIPKLYHTLAHETAHAQLEVMPISSRPNILRYVKSSMLNFDLGRLNFDLNRESYTEVLTLEALANQALDGNEVALLAFSARMFDNLSILNEYRLGENIDSAGKYLYEAVPGLIVIQALTGKIDSYEGIKLDGINTLLTDLSKTYSLVSSQKE